MSGRFEPMNDPTPHATRGPLDDQLFRLMVESAHDYAIFSLDNAGVVTSWNTGAERLMGWAHADAVGNTADVIFTAEDRAAGVPEQERTQAAKRGRAEDERWQQRKDGTRFWASGLMMRLDEPNAGFVKVLRDRTDAHLANERLRKSEERFRLLATNIPQLVFRSMSDGNRTWPSPQWIEFTGLGVEQSLGFGWLDAIHPEDRGPTLAAWTGAIDRGEYYCEHRLRRRSDGQYRWHQTRARSIGRDEPRDWVGTMTDIHDLRALQERQRVLMAELQHRTRNLLAIVQTIVSRTLRGSDSLQSFELEFSRRLQALSRVQALISGVDYQSLDLRDLLIAELQAHDGRQLNSGRVTLDGPAFPLPAAAAQALGLAFHELVTNAVKYGALAQERGGLAVNWQVDRRDAEQVAKVEWKESGVAMPQGVARRAGYGRELIERALPYQLGAETELQFEPDGVRCSITVTLKSPTNG
jgi:PAS domain S-box-containing protein